MKPQYVIAIAAICLTASAARAADADFERTFTVSGTPTVSIHTGAGYIHIYSGAGNQVHIRGHVHSRALTDADRIVQAIVQNPPVKQTGDIVSATVPEHNGSIFFNELSIDYDVTAPPNSTVEAKTGSGQLEIGGIQGTVTAGTGSGSIHVDNIGARAHLTTGSGHIQATNVHGTATLHTGSGGIEIAVDGPGDVSAGTGSGRIQISGVHGGARVTTGSGSVSIAGQPTDEWRIQTGSGSVHMQVPNDARYNVDLHSGSGGIHVNHTLLTQGSMDKHHITGSVNGGGPTVRAQTGSGSVTID